MDMANLGGAQLLGVDLSGADLSEAYLGGALLVKADMRNARLEKANMESADLTEANLGAANLKLAYCEGANLRGALLEGANLDACNLARADLSGSDLRGASARGTRFDGATLTGAWLTGVDLDPEQLASVVAEWVNFSTSSTELKVPGSELVAFITKVRSAAFAPAPLAPAAEQNKRFFGIGDVLRNASLEFGEGSVVEIESTFERCSIALREGARLVVGTHGVLRGCQISGAGEIVVHGIFEEADLTPGFVGPTRLIVGREGVVAGVVKQAAASTQFAFERGCILRLGIQR